MLQKADVLRSSGVSGAQERHLQLEASVTQRLKWAAGANPNLASLVATFEEGLSSKNSVVVAESELASELVTVCSALHHFETHKMQSTEKAVRDANFSQLITTCKESCQIMANTVTELSATEESIMAATVSDSAFSWPPR